MTQTTRRTTITRQGLDSDDNDSDSNVDEIEDDHPGAPPAGVCGHNELDVDNNESDEDDDTSEPVEDDGNDNDAATALERQMDEKYGVCTGEHNLRPWHHTLWRYRSGCCAEGTRATAQSQLRCHTPGSGRH